MANDIICEISSENELICEMSSAGEIVVEISGVTYQSVAAELAGKASVEDVALKADATYVDSQDALKADVTYVDSQDALKADVTYVDSQFALKADKVYIHDQIAFSKDWTITHNLDKYPSVTVVDSALSVVVGEVEYIDTLQVVLHFTAEFAGKAYLN